MNKLKKLFSNYIRGKSTRDEKKIIDLWFEEKGKSLIDPVSNDEVEQFSQRIWNEFLIYEERTKTKRRWSPRILYGLVGTAAIILLLVLLDFPSERLNSGGHPERHATTEVTRQFVTDDNMKRITLADGSKIHMNKGTVIELRNGKFNAYTREVWLEEGEAFFEVVKDPGRPFIVHTPDGMNARVLGTSFNIKAYHQLESQVVSVKTGCVQVSNETGEKVLLDVNQKAIFHAATQQITAGLTDGTAAADWRSGLIVLEHVGMNELAFRLKQYYGVEVVNKAVSEEMEIYTSFHISTPLEHVVKNVANVFGVFYKIENNTIYFY
ncbi:FecR family protein [Proteiniphilum sp. UBA5384]|uniref:FecR family protein n=1 Tax=Proteiniphilum sp. UBA5384 TaxID=1947279 RepID=UPI0025D9942F|nr:FecR family protein [Proteiniphilum sp. UBA5384]